MMNWDEIRVIVDNASRGVHETREFGFVHVCVYRKRDMVSGAIRVYASYPGAGQANHDEFSSAIEDMQNAASFMLRCEVEITAQGHSLWRKQ